MYQSLQANNTGSGFYRSAPYWFGALRRISVLSLSLLIWACTDSSPENQPVNSSTIDTPPVAEESSHSIDESFGADAAFLQDHFETVLLGDPDGAIVAVVPGLQGRVMISSAQGMDGKSHGWVNRALIENGIAPEQQRTGLTQHFHAFGGADRFWIGPEGGQFNWYFKPGDPFEFSHWKVPAFIDTLPWEVVARDKDLMRFEHRQQLQNWSGISFDMTVQREVALLDNKAIASALGMTPASSVMVVAYESRNTLVNSGATDWTEVSGMPSIWVLGMLKHGASTVVAIPFNRNADGRIVKDDYFGKVPAARLIVNEAASVIYFAADGAYRSKIGVSPGRSLGLAGSWDALRSVLTIVQYNTPSPDSRYVNSSWELQNEPFKGDAINSYNDGPIEGDTPLGPFYEIETSSPALALKPGESYQHVHRTIHLEGPRPALNEISQQLLGVTLSDIENAL